MYRQKRFYVKRITPVLIAVIVLVSFVACGGFSDTYLVTIENQTSQVLSIYDSDTHIFDIEPSRERTIPFHFQREYDIKAQNARGETVFSRKVKLEQMGQKDKSTYKIVIPPLSS